MPLPDPTHDLKLFRSCLFNYRTCIDNHFISLKLLRSAREDSNGDIAHPIVKYLPHICLRNKDQMNMSTATAILKTNLLEVIPDNSLMCTIVPEQERFWHQNLAKSVLKLPSAVAFLPKHSILAIADKSSSTVFLANLHNPVCLIQIAGPKDSISSPVGIVFKDCQIIVFNSGTSSSIKIIDISYVLKKSRALL